MIELGGIGPVPHAGMMLADMGADVIEIVRPGSGGVGSVDVLRRGKRSVALDLKAPGGGDALLKLVNTAAALIEGYRPGVAEGLGVGPEECMEVNPSLVYGRMTGWGQVGPLAARAGHDIDYIAVSGALASVGPRERPLPPLNLVGDFGGGSMLLVTGVLAALRHAERTGEGQIVDAAMVDGSALLMAMHHGAVAEGWWFEERGTNLFDGSAPFYTTYETADGEWMAVGALEPQFFDNLVKGLGLDRADLPPQMDRSRWPELRSRFEYAFRSRSRADWEDVFGDLDACVAGVYSIREAAGHPQIKARETLVEVDGTCQPAPAPRMTVTPLRRPRTASPFGQETHQVLLEAGLTPEELDGLAAQGTVPQE